jgi:hypothetical protein
MSLHDAIQADAISVFCNTSDFAETATYYPRGGQGRPVRVVIIRDALALVPEDNDVVTPVSEIHVAASGTYGIKSEELDIGGDMIEFEYRIGRDMRPRSIIRLLGHDEGMLVLECR